MMNPTELEQLRACAQAEQAFAALEVSSEPNPWEGSIAALTAVQREHERLELRGRGARLVDALARFRRLNADLETQRALSEKTIAEEKVKANTPTIARWTAAGRVAGNLGVYSAWQPYSEWLTSNRSFNGRAPWQFPQPEWPAALVFDDAERAEVKDWLSLTVQCEVERSQVDSIRSFIAAMLAEYPELAAVSDPLTTSASKALAA